MIGMILVKLLLANPALTTLNRDPHPILKNARYLTYENNPK
jgi:hypothetical protein